MNSSSACRDVSVDAALQKVRRSCQALFSILKYGGKMEPQKKYRWVIVIFTAILACPILYCCVFPPLTGQSCFDFVSGHIPTTAEERFLHRIIEDTVNQDYQWIQTVSSDQALGLLRKIQPQVTIEYKVIFGDDLAGMYERRIEFDSGLEIYLVFDGTWPSCPDFRVTDEEISKNMKLRHIRIESER